ncbi:MAG: sugar ABC transporter permease [Treponema sp.]|jgi:multiple sugar transport system permease protein|nr:sugar ABC transporter permease [Treponema sp.]
MTQRSKARLIENFWGYLFILPNLIGFLVFTLGGVVFSVGMSFTDWNLLRGVDKAKFVGLANYMRLFVASDFWISLRNNLFLLLAIPISIMASVVIAALLHQKPAHRHRYAQKLSNWGRAGMRALYFLPYITNVVAVSTVWRALFHPSEGPINMFLKWLGVPGDSLPGWLSSSKWFLPAIMIIVIWQNLGYYILMYSAGLQSISREYYEAVAVDGGNAYHKFRYITVPLLAPTTFVVSVLGVISSLQMWLVVQALTPNSRGFGTASYTLSYYIYRSSFIDYRSGYAAALSLVLCAITLVITLIQWKGQKKWDYT